MALVTTFQGYSLHVFTADPNAGAGNPGRRGDYGARSDAGQVRLYQNVDGTATGWRELPPPGGGTWTLTNGLVIQGSSFHFQGTIFTIGEGLFSSLATAVADYMPNNLVTTFVIHTEHPGGVASPVVGPLSARTGGWRLYRAWTRSRGGTGGSLTLLDAAGGNAMTDAIVPGNANDIVNASQIIRAEQDVPSAASPVWSGALGTPAADCYTEWVGL